MAMKLYDDAAVYAIANAIREKNGESTQYKIGEMAQAILDIPTAGGDDNLGAFISGTLTGELIDQNVTAVKSYAFYNSPAVNSVSFPNCTIVNSRGFLNATSIKTLHLPAVTRASGDYVFASMSNLEMLCLPSMSGAFGGFAVQSGTKLKTADLGGITSIGGQNFSGCSILDTVILRRTEGIAALSNINAFNNTPFASAGTGGTLYVPQALISTYQSATNWSIILSYTNNQIKPIEGSIYETQYADGTPIE